MTILVLGAGVVGVASAWYLRAAGLDVTVVDRQPGAGLETSFANGGQISVSHAEPWANPHAPLTMLRWLGHEDAPLLLRPRWDPALFAWGARFLGECLPARTAANIGAIVRLASYSRSRLQALRRDLAPAGGLDYDCLERGILHFYTDARVFAAQQRAAETMRAHGCDRRPVAADECVAIEPALAAIRPRIVGGDFTAEDESGDAHRFTRGLAEHCARAGVRFRYGAAVARLVADGRQVRGVELADGERLDADAVVVALGSWSPRLLRPLGIRIPVYPGKGYSATIPLGPGSRAPTVSLLDDEAKIVFSRLGERLRVAGTAEFTGYDTTLTPARCEALMRRTRELFPDLAPAGEPEFWTGLRPATPSNRPLIGRTGYRNLYLNTGHGTLGWTMACGSGAALADIVRGGRPEPDFTFLTETA